MIALLTGAALIVPAAGADAGVVSLCAFSAGTATITLSGGQSATLTRSGTAITVNGVACDTATVLNTDLIAVTSPDSFGLLTIDLSAGPLAPGVSDEGDGSSEIETTVSSPGAPSDISVIGSSVGDHIVADDLANTLDLNGDEAVADDDVTMTVSSDVAMIDTREGDDTIETAHTEAHLIGGDGADLFRSTDDGLVQIDGVAGDDVVSYARNTTPVRILGDSSQWIVGEPGGPYQQLSSIETLEATALDDTITAGNGVRVDGRAGADQLAVYDGTSAVSGGPGNDLLAFGPATPLVVRFAAGTGTGVGLDTMFTGIERVDGTEEGDLFIATTRNFVIDGGGGVDTYSLKNLPHGVRVDLKTGQVSSGDRLHAILNVVGSPFADRIRGSAVPNALLGGEGDDVLRGLEADDLLSGGGGDDLLDGGGGTDECHGGAGHNVLVSC